MNADAVSVWALDEAGRPHETVSASRWLRPRDAELVGDEVRWTAFRDQRRADSWVTSSTLLLTEFMALADATDTQVLRFVKRFGALGVCLDHGEPHGLLPPPFGVLPEPPCNAFNVMEGSYTDPIAAYRQLASQASALLAATSQVQRRQDALHRLNGSRNRVAEATRQWAVPEHTWRTLNGLFDPPLTVTHDLSQPLDPQDEVWLLHIAMWHWLRLGRVNLGWEWDGRGRPEIKLSTPHLFGAVALQTALATTRAVELPTCHACGKPFTPKTLRDNNRFCQACRDQGRAKAVRAAEYRARKRRRATGGEVGGPDG